MSGTRLWHWRYTLRSRGRLSARNPAREHAGALIRDFGGGVGCVHPWPTLGDAPLDEQLAAIASDRPTALGHQSLLCAEADGLARRQGRNLFAPLSVPVSHWTAAEDDDAEGVGANGFRSVKLKLGPGIDGAGERARHWAAAGFRLRLDFNDTLTETEFAEFWRALGDQARAAVDFVEDPCPWHPGVWRRLREELGAPLAADRDVMTRAAEADWLIVKPAVINAIEPAERAFRSGQRLAFTSYLDHAIGQLHAAWRAAECAAVMGSRLGDCGLITHPLFEPDPFFEQLGHRGAVLTPPPGTGLGFDELLETLPWKPLC